MTYYMLERLGYMLQFVVDVGSKCFHPWLKAAKKWPRKVQSKMNGLTSALAFNDLFNKHQQTQWILLVKKKTEN